MGTVTHIHNASATQEADARELKILGQTWIYPNYISYTIGNFINHAV
jgi:hypothetical protein